MYEELKDKYGLRPVWDAISEIYLEFARICKKYNLRYYASGGTALGAVRHNGFIPWDDDIDVMLPRSDYEKFLEVAKNELPSYLKVVNRHNTPEFHMLYSKIQDCRKDKVLEVERKVGKLLSGGLFIDFYPMDGAPVGWRVLWTKFRLLALDVLWRFRCEQFKILTLKGRVAWILGSLMAPFLPHLHDVRSLTAAYDGILQEIPYDDARAIADIGYLRSPFVQPIMKPSFFGMPLIHKFENFEIMLPSDIDGYCINKFGANYMQLPPEEKRCTTHEASAHSPWWLGPTNNNIS